MQDAQPSRTASRVALRRAAHQVLDRPLVFEDPLALKILRWDAAELLQKNPAHFERGRLTKFLRAFLAVRSRIAEDTIAGEIAAGTAQVVILGAGLDTFAYRQRTDLRVFEVDHPATQAWKRRRLGDTGIAIPPSLTFVPVDFERHALTKPLVDAGFDPARPAVFSWLGVTPYLEEASVWNTLGDIAAMTAAGGGVVFDYSIPPSTLGFMHRFFFRQLEKRVRRAGEPFKSYFEPDALERKLRELGFSRVTDLGPDEINAKYFSGRTDGLRVGAAGHVVVALT